jgi:hypothetical protein
VNIIASQTRIDVLLDESGRDLASCPYSGDLRIPLSRRD